jgi:hypothetical protein
MILAYALIMLFAGFPSVMDSFQKYVPMEMKQVGYSTSKEEFSQHFRIL